MQCWNCDERNSIKLSQVEIEQMQWWQQLIIVRWDCFRVKLKAKQREEEDEVKKAFEDDESSIQENFQEVVEGQSRSRWERH